MINQSVLVFVCLEYSILNIFMIFFMKKKLNKKLMVCYLEPEKI